MSIKKCPNCKTKGIEFFLGFTTGNYLCRKCGYIGPIIIEEATITEKKKKKKTIKKAIKKKK